MALSHVTAVRNLFGDQLDNYINTTGATNAAGQFVVVGSSVDLVTFALDNPAFGAASGGTITLAGVPHSTTASATGTADSFDVRDRTPADVFSGTVTGTGGGGDVEIDNTSITNGQTVELTSFSWTAPA